MKLIEIKSCKNTSYGSAHTRSQLVTNENLFFNWNGMLSIIKELFVAIVIVHQKKVKENFN